MKLVKWFDKNLELLILAIMLAVMCCLSFANVIMRYGFHHALTWSDEICCYLLALSAFYCLPCAVRHGVSIKVDTFTTMIPESLQKTLGLVCDGVMILLLAYLFKGTQELIQKADLIHQASPALAIPVADIYRIMAFGILLGIFRYAQLMVRVFQGKVNLEADNGNDLEKGRGAEKE